MAMINTKGDLTPVPGQGPDMQGQPTNKDALSTALQNRRIAKANKRRMTPSNDADDSPGQVETGENPTE